jgi:hypothetical protein
MVGVACHCGAAENIGELKSQSFQYDKAGLSYAMSSKSSHARSVQYRARKQAADR